MEIITRLDAERAVEENCAYLFEGRDELKEEFTDILWEDGGDSFLVEDKAIEYLKEIGL